MKKIVLIFLLIINFFIPFNTVYADDLIDCDLDGYKQSFIDDLSGDNGFFKTVDDYNYLCKGNADSICNANLVWDKNEQSRGEVYQNLGTSNNTYKFSHTIYFINKNIKPYVDSDYEYCDFDDFKAICKDAQAKYCSENRPQSKEERENTDFAAMDKYIKDFIDDSKGETCTSLAVDDVCSLPAGNTWNRVLGKYCASEDGKADSNCNVSNTTTRDNSVNHCKDVYSRYCKEKYPNEDCNSEYFKNAVNDALKSYDFNKNCDNGYTAATLNILEDICNDVKVNNDFKKKCPKYKNHCQIMIGDQVNDLVDKCDSVVLSSISSEVSSYLKENISLSEFLTTDTIDCTDISAITDLVNNIFGTIRIFAIVGTILLSSLDFMKPIIADDGDVDKKIKKAEKDLGTRLIVILILFLLPIIITVIFNNMGGIFGNVCR